METWRCGGEPRDTGEPPALAAAAAPPAGAAARALEAAIENDDPAEVRRIVARFDFSEAQHRHVEGPDRRMAA